MNRSGYVQQTEANRKDYKEWRGRIKTLLCYSSVQALLGKLAQALDDMPVKELIAGELISGSGQVCAIGALCQSQGITHTQVKDIKLDDVHEIAALIQAPYEIVAEIEAINDEKFARDPSPAYRWRRVRDWVEKNR